MSITFNTILTNIITRANKEGISAMAALAIRDATIKVHSMVDLVPDIVTLSIFLPDARVTVGAGPYAVSNTTLFIPKTDTFFVGIRKLHEVRTNSADGTANRSYVQLAPSDTMFETYIKLHTNVLRWGVNQDMFLHNFDFAPAYINIAGFLLPNTASQTYQSWIADMYPYIIEHAALAELYLMLGDKGSFGIYEGMTRQNLMFLHTKHGLPDNPMLIGSSQTPMQQPQQGA